MIMVVLQYVFIETISVKFQCCVEQTLICQGLHVDLCILSATSLGGILCRACGEGRTLTPRRQLEG